MSRNRLIVESCRRVVEERSCWPEGLFSNDHLTEQDLKQLRQGERAFQEVIAVGRKSRASTPFDAAPQICAAELHGVRVSAELQSR